MTAPLYKFKRVDDFPKQNQIHFLNLAFSRYHKVIDELDVSKSEKENFLLIKEVLSIYTELERYWPVHQTLKAAPENFQQIASLFKVIRNLVLHFPFFDSWSDIQFNKELILAMDPSNASIDRYFKKTDHIEFFFKLGHENMLEEGKILAPMGYNENKMVYMRDILSLESAIILIKGVTYIILMNCIEGKETSYPSQE
jgi:hypothetical protein